MKLYIYQIYFSKNWCKNLSHSIICFPADFQVSVLPCSRSPSTCAPTRRCGRQKRLQVGEPVRKPRQFGWFHLKGDVGSSIYRGEIARCTLKKTGEQKKTQQRKKTLQFNKDCVFVGWFHTFFVSDQGLIKPKPLRNCTRLQVQKLHERHSAFFAFSGLERWKVWCRNLPAEHHCCFRSKNRIQTVVVFF